MTDEGSARFDDTVHQRVRLGILTVLATADRADFAYLRESLDLTDGNLGRHLETLYEAGFVEISKAFEGRRPRTWITITRQGRTALAQHIAALRQMIDQVPEA